MPASRKACERCRKQKVRCLWSDNSATCLRCTRGNATCTAPTRPQRTPVSKTISSRASASNKARRDSWQPEGRLSSERPPGSSIQVGPEDDSRFNGIESQPTNAMPTPTTSLLSTEESSPDFRSASSLITIPFNNFSAVAQLPISNDVCGQGRCYLPDADDAYVLLKEYLHDFNSKMPLFSPDGLRQLFSECYSGAAEEASLTWVLVYTTMGITHRLRAMSLFAKSDDTAQADWYLGKSLSKLPELLLQSPCLRMVQACLTMTFLLETSGRCNRAPLFVSTALHMAQDLGFNELPNEPSYLEQRYVFWISFCLDAHMSLATQRTSAQRLSDITTLIPGENVENWWHTVDKGPSFDQPTINVFALHCSLAVIEAGATEELFSARARQRSYITNAGTYESILLKLQAWRERNILSRVEAQDVLRAAYRSDIVHFIMLEGAYFRIVYQLRATNALVGFQTKVDVFTVDNLQSLLRRDTEFLRGDALRLLKLLVLIPQGNVSTTWASLQAILAALCLVLDSYTSRVYSSDAQNKEVLQICKEVLLALDSASENVTDAGHASAIEMCRQMYYRAQKV